MPSNSPDSSIVTVNVFTVAPADQPRLIELLTQATDSTVRHVEGFVSAALHRSLDGSKVTMVARWRSLADYEKMRAKPNTSPYLEEALAIAKFDPGIYEVVATFSG